MNLNPSDVFHVKHYVYASYLYFEQLEKCKELLGRELHEDTFLMYVRFLLLMKEEQINEAKAMVTQLAQANTHLFDMLTYRMMNTAAIVPHFEAGSFEEAAYIYKVRVMVAARASSAACWRSRSMVSSTVLPGTGSLE